MPYSAPRGTKDIMPDEVAVWRWLEGKFRHVCRLYDYREIRTPIFEDTGLFARSAGETSDIVTKQMYTFEDKGGHSLTLRPEGTPAVVRAYLEHGLAATSPVARFFYMGPIFRYERPQAGRYRQHHQVGVECFGVADATADAEVIALGRQYLQDLGITGAMLYINSIGCNKCRPAFRQALRRFLEGVHTELCGDCQRRVDANPLRVLDCKVDRCRELTQNAPEPEAYLCPECKEHFALLLALLTEINVEYRIDPRLVRGLDYYTRTVFEFKHSQGLGTQDTIIGGGRYDYLVEQFGGPPTPAIGFGSGIERTLMVVQALGVNPPPLSGPYVFVAPIGAEAARKAVRLATDLRSLGVAAELGQPGRSLKAQMRQANRSGAALAALIGEQELAEGVVAVRSLATGDQTLLQFEDAARSIAEQSRVAVPATE